MRELRAPGEEEPGGAKCADRRKEVAGDHDGPGLGGRSADRMDDRNGRRGLQRFGDALRKMERRGGGQRARIVGFGGANGAVERGRGDQHRGGERPSSSVKPVFRSPKS